MSGKPLFIHSTHCMSRKKCERCRDDGPAGQVWRETMAIAHETPGGGSEWVCPFGVVSKPCDRCGGRHVGLCHFKDTMNQQEIEAAALLKRLGITPPAPGQPWPSWTQAIAVMRSPDDRGLGDTASRVLDRFGAGILKRAYRAAFGRDCGCGTRQLQLNEWFPYLPATSATPEPPRP